MGCSTPGLPVHHQLPQFPQTHVHWVGDAIHHLILCHPLLLKPSIFPSIRVFSSESALRIRWPKYWSFSFSISPSSEYSGLISFRMDWLDLLAVQGSFMSLLQNHSSKASNLGNSAVATGLEKVSFHSNPKKGNPKECSNYCTTALISHSSKVMLKIIQNRLQQYVNHELPDVQGGLEKAEESEIKLPTSTGSLKKQESSRKTSISALLIMPKPLCGSPQMMENSLRDGNTRPPDLPPEKSVCRSRSKS